MEQQRARPPTQYKITCVEVVKDGRKQLAFMGTEYEGGDVPNVRKIRRGKG